MDKANRETLGTAAVCDNLMLDHYYQSQTVYGENATISDNNVISATLAHRPVLASTVVVEVFVSASDTVPCLRVSFDSNGNPDGNGNSSGDLTVDVTTPNATAFNHHTSTVQVTLSAGVFPTGAVARVNYEYDMEYNQD